MRKLLLSLIASIPIILSSCTSAPLQPTIGIRKLIGYHYVEFPFINGNYGFKATSRDYDTPLTSHSSRNEKTIAQLYDSKTPEKRLVATQEIQERNY